MTIISKTWVEGTITDSLGSVTEIDSLESVNTAGLLGSTSLHLVNGDNTFLIPQVPFPARGVIISCDIGCDTFKILKGATGDAGITIFTDLANADFMGTFMLLFGSSPGASFIITSIGADTFGITEVFFF